MERNELIKTLMEKSKVSYEEAEDVLQKFDWNLIDSVIYLERKGKAENNETAAIVEVKEKNEERNYRKKSGGIREVMGRIFKFIGKIIDKGNQNHFEIRKEKDRPIKISLTISVLLLIIAFWPVAILLVIGLFLGYKYSIVGPNINVHEVNNILNKASESADNIKNDFKEGYKG
ncbi:DUF4342 domain-containing protein [Clostridium oryzae]|uniref:DUF4342 domain-containing protein n=1 Tax=Clostridium oryzae TaxID=1450648 RepID=A0A1V4IWI1_9CLOT|nr:DUF4342 domain-containing protein [Clostridium oryzae]OPJ64408.1 hypothetical protein CLORY_06020 [Clostridium oryzae]